MSLLFYASQKTPKNINPRVLKLTNNKPKTILAIQSESFIVTDQPFDYPDTNNTIQGKLNVPCYGAYTMRSEFSFLTGISSSQLKHQSFNPYRKTYKYISNNYIKQLKNDGYHCVVIHPFKKAFFNRNKVFTHLGFDQFIDESAFNKTDIFTPDYDLTEFVQEYLDINKNKNLFVFVITIAGHGPYTLPRKDPKKYLAKSKDNEIDTYLDLNFKANEMLKSLLEIANKDTILIWYGDHKPSISTYNLSQSNYYKTDYFISLGKNKNYYKNTQELSVEDLLRFSLEQYHLLK
ncbi:LTA synthase family protein [Francisella philomiragia]|uniref:LTA synthase family protein n=1 Tax=Francisella philomiragia TaxID=28110 RepID=UPI001F1D2548|nr:LTA synthase family protein [Francisella philomiragia]